MPAQTASSLAAPSHAWKGLLLQLFKGSISIALMYLLVRRTDLGKIFKAAAGTRIPLLGAAVAVVFLAMMLSSYRWQLLLDAQNAPVPFLTLFRYFLVGLFFNNFLPSNIGGDVMRIRDVSRHTGNTSAAAVSVLLDRLLAAFALSFTAGCGALFSGYGNAKVSGIIFLVFSGTSTVLVILGVNRFWERGVGGVNSAAKPSLLGRILKAGASINAGLRNRGTVGVVVLYSIVFQLLVVAAAYLIFLSLGSQVSFASCLVFIPIISAVQLLPVSISGFGVREGAYVYLFGTVGVASTVALASSLLFWLVVAIVSLPGGLIFAMRK